MFTKSEKRKKLLKEFYYAVKDYQEAEKRKKVASTVLRLEMQRLETDSLTDGDFTAIISKVSRKNLDKEALTCLLGEKLALYEKPIEYSTMRIAR